MGIQVEFNPDLALRNIVDYQNGNRLEEECIPKQLGVGGVYSFLKNGQRNYWLEGEIPLLETKGGGRLSKPLASIQILEATHHILEGNIWTKGKYIVREVYERNDSEIHFNGFAKVER